MFYFPAGTIIYMGIPSCLYCSGGVFYFNKFFVCFLGIQSPMHTQFVRFMPMKMQSLAYLVIEGNLSFLFSLRRFYFILFINFSRKYSAINGFFRVLLILLLSYGRFMWI
jgi:hypothetical protein